MSSFTNTRQSNGFVLKSNTPSFSTNNTANSKITLNATSFEAWRSYIYELCGIYFQDNKKYLLESRLLKRISHLKLTSFEEYLKYLRFNPQARTEKKYLYEAITINETFFFRNQPQLDALTSKIFAETIEKKRKLGKRKIRIWSAASSSGEEAYSVAMVITDMVKPKFRDIEFEIVGTDINEDVLSRARTGVYKEYAIRNTPAFFLKKYFRKEGMNYIIDPKLRSMVKFSYLNLADDISMRNMINYDIIFCANVLIYFDAKSKVKVVSHLYNSLNRGGYLFIGYAETLHGISKAFKLESFPKTISYKKE
ncbi:MAG: protein-glutamate O-methyltransferase CheR [Melioribacteraceae bacterium]|nr:protein-glutamate O-methyltransferase CheR [Melioribacteraceae bacterium]